MQVDEKKEAAQRRRLYRFRQVLYSYGFENIAGVDEVGRGPLAGPVVAAAVILPKGLPSLAGWMIPRGCPESQRNELYKKG